MTIRCYVFNDKHSSGQYYCLIITCIIIGNMIYGYNYLLSIGCLLNYKYLYVVIV